MSTSRDWNTASPREIDDKIFSILGHVVVCDKWPCAVAQDGVTIDAVVDVVEKNGTFIPASKTDADIYTHMLPVMIIEGKTGIWPPRQSPRGKDILEAWVLPVQKYATDIIGALMLVTDMRRNGFGVSIESSPNAKEFKCTFWKRNMVSEGGHRGVGESLPLAVARAYVVAIEESGERR